MKISTGIKEELAPNSRLQAALTDIDLTLVKRTNPRQPSSLSETRSNSSEATEQEDSCKEIDGNDREHAKQGIPQFI